MGLPPYEGWGDEWSRNASATQMYLKANRPQPAVEVPLHFLRGTELLQIEQSTCDPCFYHNQPLVESLPLLRQLLDFWHSDCGHDAIQPCASAYVIVVDDEDHEADEDLLRMLAARMWDKPLPDIKSELLHRCASVDEPASLLAAWALEKPGQTAAGWRVGRSTAGGTSAPRSHRQVGCMLLRDRYNTRVRQFWQPRKVDMDEREEKVREFLKGPHYHAMTRGLDTENTVLRAYLRRLGMDSQVVVVSVTVSMSVRALLVFVCVCVLACVAWTCGHDN